MKKLILSLLLIVVFSMSAQRKTIVQPTKVVVKNITMSYNKTKKTLILTTSMNTFQKEDKDILISFKLYKDNIVSGIINGEEVESKPLFVGSGWYNKSSSGVETSMAFCLGKINDCKIIRESGKLVIDTKTLSPGEYILVVIENCETEKYVINKEMGSIIVP